MKILFLVYFLTLLDSLKTAEPAVSRTKRGLWLEALCETYTCPGYKKCKELTNCMGPFRGQHRSSCKKLCTDGAARVVVHNLTVDHIFTFFKTNFPSFARMEFCRKTEFGEYFTIAFVDGKVQITTAYFPEPIEFFSSDACDFYLKKADLKSRRVVSSTRKLSSQAGVILLLVPSEMSAINPSEIICPSSTPHGCVFRHLVIRNSRPEDVLLKIRIDKEASRFVSFDQHTLRIPGKAVIFIKMTVYPDRVGYFVRNGYHIRGYVRLVDKTKEKELNKWLHTPGIETPRQMAFDLRLIFANKFSAPETIIDVPGLANTLEPHVGIFGVDDKDTITAVAIDADCKTAYDLNSIAEYINEVKRRASQPKTYLETAADVVTEVVKSWYEKPKKKMITDSEYINHEMNVTPCGGN